jgi:hypothetical protein
LNYKVLSDTDHSAGLNLKTGGAAGKTLFVIATKTSTPSLTNTVYER